mgnify:CR=1 FL=1
MADAKAQVREMAGLIASKEADAAKARAELKNIIENDDATAGVGRPYGTNA